MTQNGVYLTSSGDLLRAAMTPYDFENDGAFDSGTETIRTDVPVPAYTEHIPDSDDKHHKWNGSAWVLVVRVMEYRLISSQAGVPATIPGTVGLMNIDTTNDDVYISTDTVGSGDWTLMAKA